MAAARDLTMGELAAIQGVEVCQPIRPSNTERPTDQFSFVGVQHSTT